MDRRILALLLPLVTACSSEESPSHRAGSTDSAAARAPAGDSGRGGEATALSVGLFAADGQAVLSATRLKLLVALFREFGFDPGLFAACARRCVASTASVSC